jgi:peptidoglycan/LPS O-acetylase OafA/YrhL
MAVITAEIAPPADPVAFRTTIRAIPRPGSPERFHRPELDALRLAAFLLVWLSHSLPAAAELASRQVSSGLTWWLLAIKDAGNFGVCVFFFLSAYLITELLRRELALTGTVALPAFYVRRILRIWPLYLGVLAAYALLGIRFHGFRIEPGRLTASLLLAGNWYIALHPTILTPMRALWSISVEEQFYLAWPAFFKHASPRRAIHVAIAVLVLGIASASYLAGTQPSAWLHVTVWVNSLVQFQYFALGALTAIWLAGRVPALPGTVRCTAAVLAAALALVAAGVCQIKRSPVAGYTAHWPHAAAVVIPIGYLLVGGACLALFFSVLGLRRVPDLAVALGKVSFGLYVFHETGFFLADEISRPLTGLSWPWALVANKLLALALTVPLALASYQFWEKPFLRLKERFTVVRSRLA